MFASQRGLGFLLMNAIGLHNVDLIMALTFGLVVFAGTAGIVLLGDRPAAASSVQRHDRRAGAAAPRPKTPLFRPFPP